MRLDTKPLERTTDKRAVYTGNRIKYTNNGYVVRFMVYGLTTF